MSKFKLGDRVAVYSPGGRDIGIVDDIESFGGVLIGIKKSNGFSDHFHPKQLRKLKKREPKYIWISSIDLSQADPTGQESTTAKICVNQGNYFSDKYWTKVKIIK